jgi:medium-chain acyl-[acyl-carrier-protein] hydrolase
MNFLLSNPNMRFVSSDSSDKLRLFCFPYGGGSTDIFRNWVNHFEPAIEVCPVELPGHGRRIRESLVRRLDDLVEDLAARIFVRLDTPFAFFGHSMGGLVGFELARLLRRRHECQPLHLFVSATSPPHLVRNREPMHRLPDLEFLQRLRELNGTPKEVLESADVMEMMLPILRADMEVCEMYCYCGEDILNCPITALGGQFDTEVPPDQLREWKHHTTGPFKELTFAGDHFFLRECRLSIIRAIYQELSTGSQIPPHGCA